jgi:hypothetical protein
VATLVLHFRATWGGALNRGLAQNEDHLQGFVNDDEEKGFIK